MYQQTKFDLKIIIPILLLAIISILSIHSASIYISETLGNLALRQAFWYLVGIILIFFIIKMKNNIFYRYAWLLYILGNILLLGLLFFAPPINNARIWYVIPGIGSFQPSEFMKIFIMIFLATVIHHFKVKYKDPTIKEEFFFY